jgi:hypothetical protein
VALDAYLYGDPAESLDRLRAERAREADAAKKRETIRLRDKKRRIKKAMKKLGIRKNKNDRSIR